MVQTVSASPLPQTAGNGTIVQGLEPGTELKARVEANLPGGIVRLATADARLELRVSAPLPEGAEVTVTVAGSKQQPAILITAGKDPGQAPAQSVPVTAAGTANPPQGQPQSGSAAPAQGSGPVPAQSGSASPVSRPAPVLAHLVQVLSAGAESAPASGPGAQSPAAAAPVPQQAGGITAAGPVPSSPAGQPPQSGSSVPVPSGPASASTTSTPPATPAGSTSADVAGQAGGTRAAPLQAGAAPVSIQTANSAIVQGPVSALPLTNAPSGSAAPVQPATSPPGQAMFPGPAGTGMGLVQGSAQNPAGASSPTTPAGAQLAVSGQATAGSGSIGQPVPPVSSSGAVLGLKVSAGSAAPQPGGPAGAPQQATAQGAPLSQGTSGLQAPAGNLPPATAGVTSGPAVQPPASAQRSGNTAAAPGQSLSFNAAAVSNAPGQPATPATAAFPSSQQVSVTLSPGAAAPAGRSDAPQPAGIARTGFAQAYPAQGTQAPVPSTVDAGGSAAANPARQIAQLLHQPLAEQQAGLGSLFAQIGSLLTAQSSGSVSLPDPVVKAMQQILGLRLNTAGPPTAKGLQTAVQLSGLFREAGLSRPGTAPAGLPDLKSALLSFKALLQQLGTQSEIARPAGQPPAPSRHGSPQAQAQQAASGFWAGAAPQNLKALMKETDAALARIRMTQLANTKHGGEDAARSVSRPMDLVVELPLALGQQTAILQLQIGRDGGGKEEGQEDEPSWRLRFALDLTATGPLEAAISLRGGGTFASLWIDRKDTFDFLNAQRETMEAAFADAGLDLQELRLIRGLPPRTAARYGALIDRQS